MKKGSLGVVTCLPLIYMVAFFLCMVYFMSSPGIMAPEPAGPDAGFPISFLILFVVHAGVMVLTIGLLIYYLVRLFRHDDVPADNKMLWGVVLFLGGPIAMPVYWYLYVWPD